MPSSARALRGLLGQSTPAAASNDAASPKSPPPTGRPATWRDHLGNQASQGLRYEPRSRDELLAAVAEAARTGRSIRAVGSGKSSSGAARPEGGWVDLRALRRHLSVTGLRPGVPSASFVRVESGIALDELRKQLRARGLALAAGDPMGSQTLAGAISTSGHGSSLKHGPLADSVASVDLMVLESERGRLQPRVVRVEPGDGITCPRWFASDRHQRMRLLQNDELFYGAVVGLGATGVACAYTLAVQPLAEVEEQSWEVPWSELAGELSALARDHDSVEIVLYPHPTGSRGPGLSRDACIPCLVTTRDSAATDARPRPLARTPMGRGATKAAPRSILGEWRRACAIELSVPLDDAACAVAALLDETEAMRKDGLIHAAPVTLRFVANSRHALAMSFGRATCSIEAALVAGTRRTRGGQLLDDDEGAIVRRVQRAIETVVPTARPHWGMTHEVSGADLSARYPGALAWRKACHAFDPRGSFLNAMTRALLWNGGSPATSP